MKTLCLCLSGKQKPMSKKPVSINNNEITQKNDTKQVKKSIQANKKNTAEQIAVKI